jgi:hypothetical protein
MSDIKKLLDAEFKDTQKTITPEINNTLVLSELLEKNLNNEITDEEFLEQYQTFFPTSTNV